MTSESELKVLLLAKPKLTLAAAESLTGGHVQARITSVSGASNYFLGGITAYSLEQKVKLLGVNRAHARKENCVSQRVAVEMAQGAAMLFNADIAVATTGYAEASPKDGIASPMAWWAIVHAQRGGKFAIMSGMLEMPRATREIAQERVAGEVLRELVKYLREWRG
ncbi:CinA family protein [Oleiharenicola lentus]|uniref:CinA family protein n=1 Tax=Oleiharenicola lentus TaxID=2508720 RepID=UPI003F677755